MKIVYCVNNLSKIGGLQWVTVSKASALANIPGNLVWLVVTEPKINAFDIDEKVKVVNLNINYYRGTQGKGQLIQLFIILIKQLLHKKELKRLFKDISPDVVVSTGGMEKYLLTAFRSQSRILIREIHTPSDSRLFYAKTPYERLIARIGNFLDYRVFIRRYNSIVVLTEEDKNRCWKGNNKVTVIPNPLCRNFPVPSPLNEKTVISIGELSKGKNFSALVRSWSIVHKRHPEWNLLILGDGNERYSLQNLIDKLNLRESVSLMGRIKDVGSFLVRASMFAFSSLSEGFSLAILDAMACGLPVITYECPCGPKAIISDGRDGYLVPVGNIEEMAERICYLIENEDFREMMGSAARKKSMLFSMDLIIRKWMTLFNNLLGNENGNDENPLLH